MGKFMTKHRWIQLLWATIGSLMFAISVNCIITPLSLYNGGFMGISQLMRTFLVDFLNINILAGIDLVGIIYFLINVPLFYLAYKVMGLEFVIKTIITVGIQSVLLTVVPISQNPIITDYLTACIVGGILAGSGVGLVLKNGCTGGGQDILGVVCAKKYPNFSVGKVNIIMNIFIYLVCLWIFDIQIVIYSLIYTTILALAIDKVYTQTISTTAMIFTKKTGISKAIIENMGRGVTRWNGEGAYTNETSYVLVTVISKYEVSQLKKLVREIDEQAFVVLTDGNSVIGNFEKRL